MLKQEENSSQRDICGAFWGEDVPFTVRERNAYQTTEAIQKVLSKLEPADTLDLRLHEIPLYTYLTALFKRLRTLVAEGVWNRDEVYRFALALIGNTQNEERVKLGILMLGACAEEKVIGAFRQLGRISSYTLFVLEASQNFNHVQSFVWELAKGLDSYAKAAALHVLQPVTPPMKEWMLFKGIQNSVLPHLSAIICMEKADMADYLIHLAIDERNFSAFSRLLAYAFEKGGAKDFAVGLPLITKYLDAAPKLTRSFLDYSAVLAIYNSMSPSWQTDLKDVQKQNGWSSNLEQAVRGKCYNILHHKSWESSLRDEMKKPSCENCQILAGIKEMQLTPAFSDFLPMLRYHPFDFDVINFLIHENYGHYTKDTVHFIKENLPEYVFSGALNLQEDDLGSAYEPDISLCLTLKAMHREGIFDEPFFLRCLACRLPDCRKEAIRCLRKFRFQWSGEVSSAMEKACETEPTASIHKSLLRLLGKKDRQAPKEQRYVELPDHPAVPDDRDLFLFESRVAGAFYRDLLAVEGMLEEGDLLFLVREPDNQYDTNAVLVTTDDGYVLGYIPRDKNSFPAEMMDSGRKLYAILSDLYLSQSRLLIDVFLSESAYVDHSGRPFLKILKGGRES